MDAIFSMPKNAAIFFCDNCDFKCCKRSDFSRHVLTLKHKNAIKRYKLAQENTDSLFVCDCGKEFKHQPSLSRHKNFFANKFAC